VRALVGAKERRGRAGRHHRAPDREGVRPPAADRDHGPPREPDGEPHEIAAELDTPLSNTAYHVRQLASLGLLKLVRRRQRRGSIEHFYTAAVRPRLYDEIWSRLPGIVKRAIVGGKLGQIVKEVIRAAEAGGFDADDVHLTRTQTAFTREGWEAPAKELAATLHRLDQLKVEDAARRKADPHAETVDTTVVMMQFTSPPVVAEGTEVEPSQHDALQDIAPPA
jgi:hypothetical protein